MISALSTRLSRNGIDSKLDRLPRLIMAYPTLLFALFCNNPLHHISALIMLVPCAVYV